MNKLLEYGRKALFYVRVLSGYEQLRIRNYRLQLENRLQQAQERKATLRKIPEQAILAEVRSMVEEMQNLNQKLEETETAIDKYFKPIDMQAETIMKMQLEGEEKSMREMMKAMQKQALLEKAEGEEKSTREMMKAIQTQALLEKAEAQKIANVHYADTKNQPNQETESTTKQHAQMR